MEKKQPKSQKSLSKKELKEKALLLFKLLEKELNISPPKNRTLPPNIINDYVHDAELPLTDVEEFIGYRFNDKELLVQALTDSTFVEDSRLSYERLEYVGDSVLGLVIAKELFMTYPRLAPGDLTRLRSANVNREKLARVAMKHHFYRYLRHRKPFLPEQIDQFASEIPLYPIQSYGLIEAPKVLSDIVESIIGAVYVDSNSSVEIAARVIKPLLEPIIDLESVKKHPMAELLETCQKEGLKLAVVDLWKDTSLCIVFIEDELAGKAAYSNRKDIAQNRAAKDALNNIGKFLNTGEAHGDGQQNDAGSD